MKIKNNKGLYILMILAGLTAALLVVLLLSRAYREDQKDKAPYSGALLRYDGWVILREDNTVKRVDLPDYVVPESDTMTIVNVLPRALESGAYLAFESTNVFVTVRLDEDVIYQNMNESNTKAFSMWNFVLLDAAQAEGPITIEFSGSDPYDAGILPEIFLGPKSEILLLAESETRVNTQVSVSTIFFGLFVMLCALVTFSNMGYSADFILLGLFIFLLGLSQWFQIILPSGNAGTWFAKQGIGRSLFGLLPPFYCYYCARRSVQTEKKTYEAVFWVGIGYYFLVYLLRWFGSASSWHMLRIATYIIFEGIYGLCLYSTVVLEKESSLKYRLLTGVGLAALMLGIGIENFTHIGYTVMRTARPIILGALVFSMLQATAVLLNVYDHIEQQAINARELSESRFRLMINQLKPHFIRNALATIRVITRHDPQKAYDLLYDFTQYFSYNIDSIQGNELTTFTEELKHIQEYTNIEQEHMGQRLRMEYDIGPTDFEIPPLSIEPFVENAVKHGVWQKREGGTVRVISEEKEKTFVISICDDGVGFDPQNPPPPAVRGHGIGMKYAIERLNTMVSGTVKVESQPGKGTTITIEIPKTGTEAKT